MRVWPASPADPTRAQLERKPVRHRNTGELHHKAKLCDHEVELMRQLREEDPKRWSYRKLGEKFGIDWTTAQSICT